MHNLPGKADGTLCGSLLLRLAALIVAAVPVTTRAAGGDVRDGLEDQLLADAADGRLERFTLLEAALVASGADSQDDLAAYACRWAQHRQRLAEQIPDGASLRARALLTLRFLHRHVLKGSYRADATAVHRALDDGDYNCVSATILYRCLWPSGAAPLATISEEHHVYCRLVDEPPADIQTTSARGFPTAVDLDELGAAVAGCERPRAGGQKPVRAILDGQLVAKVYYNRGADLLVQGRFSDAMRCLQISCRLDREDTVARRNTLACINNWALAECDAGAYQHATERLIRGIELAPDYRPFWDNDLYVHHRWVSELCRSGEYSRAIQVLEAAYQRRPAAPLFADGRRTVSELWQRSRTDAGEPLRPGGPSR